MVSFHRKLLATAGVVVFAMAGMVLLTTPAAAAGTAYTSITTWGSGMCLDDPSGSTADHTQIQIYYCNGGTNQSWNYVPNGITGYAQLVNAASGKCLDDPGSSLQTGVVYQQYTCNFGNNQEWAYAQYNGQVRNLSSGECMAVTSAAYKTPTVQEPCDNDIDQWSFNP